MKVDRGTEWGTERGLEGEENRTGGGDGRKGKTHVACFLVHAHSLPDIHVYITYIHICIYTYLHTYAGLFGRGGGRRKVVKGGYEHSAHIWKYHDVTQQFVDQVKKLEIGMITHLNRREERLLK